MLFAYHGMLLSPPISLNIIRNRFCFMRKLINNNEGYTKAVGMIIALLVTIGIGAVVFWEITDGITGSSTEANDSLNETQDMATTVFGLLPLIALVVVGAILIGIVIRGFAGGGGKGGI